MALVSTGPPLNNRSSDAGISNWLDSASDTFPVFQHEGIEMLYMLEGEMGYRHGDTLYRMEAGDTLIFDADAPHGPEDLVRLPIRYLSVITYPQNR